MPTLDAMFRIVNGYSGPMDQIIRKTNSATDKILRASGQTDKFNQKLNATGASAGAASSGIGKLIGAAASLATALKGMSITDNYTNTSARLALINDGLQTQAELQNKIFAAADRSKGAYSSMADAVAKLQLNAGDQFKSNDEAIGFTELLQKSFKVGGSSTTEQSSAMLQLTQAMGSGKLQGDEFRSIMENAPMVADAIAKYMGKSKGELKELSSDGAITADIIKNAMFAASEDINAKFKKMPLTFADVWNKIKNGATKAFSGTMQKINTLINSEGFTQFVDGVIAGFYVIADVANIVIDSIAAIAGVFADNWSWISPIIYGVVAALVVYNATMGIAWLTTLKTVAVMAAHAVASWLETAAILALIVAQDGLNAALYACPITWIIAAIIGLIAIFYAAVGAINHFADTSFSATGLIMGYFAVLGAYIYNRFILVWNIIAIFINFLNNAFQNPVAAIQVLFYELAATVIGYISNMAAAIEKVINKIPGVEIDITSGLDKFQTQLESAAAKAKDKNDFVDIVQQKDYLDYGDAANAGYKFGQKIDDKVSSTIDSLTGGGKPKDKNSYVPTGTTSNPTKVKGTGSGGKIDVNMADEDIQYLRDIAERDYVNKFSSATLAPNINIKFGNVTKEADAEKVAGKIKKILQEEIKVASEGVY